MPKNRVVQKIISMRSALGLDTEKPDLATVTDRMLDKGYVLQTFGQILPAPDHPGILAIYCLAAPQEDSEEVTETTSTEAPAKNDAQLSLIETPAEVVPTEDVAVAS